MNRLVGWIVLIAATSLPGFPLDAAEPVAIGSRLEPFFDAELIESLRGLEHRLHTPVPAGSVLKFDRPWEGRYCGYITVLRDSDRFRMYYRGLPESKADGSDKEVTCYAESPDGIVWNKPNLGLYEYKNNNETNIVLADRAPCSHNFAPFLDTHPDAKPEERYKAVAGTRQSGLMGFVSSDGIHWRTARDEPLITEGAFDSQNVAFWSSSERHYVCYLRTWTTGEFSGFRTISRSTSPDFQHWSTPTEMDFGDPLQEHLYTNQTHPYVRAPHLFISLAARFMPGRRVLSAQQLKELGGETAYSGDCSDTVFMTSRGGTRYHRTFLESLVRPGLGIEHWSSRSNYAACGVVQTGPAELSLYVQRRYGQLDQYLERFTLRLDGFASIHAGYSGGELITKPIIFNGKTLILNLSTSAAGSLQVELQQLNGEPIDRFSLADSDTLIGDSIAMTASWNGFSDVSALADTPVRLRFVLKDADLYSFQFANP